MAVSLFTYLNIGPYLPSLTANLYYEYNVRLPLRQLRNGFLLIYPLLEWYWQGHCEIRSDSSGWEYAIGQVLTINFYDELTEFTDVW